MEDVVPINPMVERDNQMLVLKAELERAKKEESDINSKKETITKTSIALKITMKEHTRSKNKVAFARKVTKKRMDNTLGGDTEDVEEGFVSL